LRALTCLVLVLAGCAGPHANPVTVAERFHALRAEGDDRGMHELFTDADRAAMPLASFPSELPRELTEELLGWTGARLDSSRLVEEVADTARVLLFSGAVAPDTVRLVASRRPRPIPLLELERVTWKVSLRVAERNRLDSLASALRADGVSHDQVVARARAYEAVADSYPDLARPDDLRAARTALRRDEVARALGVELRVAESFMGAYYIQGRVRNPTESRVAILRLRVQDAGGEEQRVDLWDVSAAGATEVREFTQLRPGPVTYSLERIQLY
jgi:hypothetical protein